MFEKDLKFFSEDAHRAYSQERRAPDYDEFRLGQTAVFPPLKSVLFYGCHDPEFFIYE